MSGGSGRVQTAIDAGRRRESLGRSLSSLSLFKPLHVLLPLRPKCLWWSNRKLRVVKASLLLKVQLDLLTGHPLFAMRAHRRWCIRTIQARDK